jgi:hypothetical protein
MAVVVDTVAAAVVAADAIAANGKCFLPFVQPVELKLKFHLNQIQPSRFIAATVLKSPGHKPQGLKSIVEPAPKGAGFFMRIF